MGVLWDLRIDYPPGWQHLPSSRLKIKPFDLCSQLYRSPPNKCIAWSEDNLIAFSPVEQLIYSSTVDHIGNIQRPIYIVLPELPESHVTLVTSHVDTIRVLDWSSLTCGLHLLSVDMRDKACVWRMKDGVNDWVCVHECTMENVIAAKWISFEKAPKSGSRERHFTLPCGTPCFIVVSAFSRVTLWHYSPFEGWISLFCDLGPTLGYSQTHLARADIIDTSLGTVLIAVSGPCVGNTIGIYEITVDVTGATITGKLKSRVELSLPLPEIPPSVLLGPVNGVPTLIHMEFDPDSDGNAIITLVAGLSPHYQPPKIPPGSANEEGTVAQYVGNVQLERWEYKSIAVFQDRQFLLPLATLPEVKDSQPLTDNFWVPVASVPLDIPSSPSNPNRAIVREPHNRPQPEWVAGLNPYFCTLFRCFDRNVCVGFLGGGVEIRDIRTLAARGVVDEMTKASASPHSSTLTMFGSNPPIPVSATLSPNGECVATLRYDATIRLCLLPESARPIQRPSDMSVSKERQAADSLETSMMKGTDPWDIFIRVLHDPKNNFLHLGVCDCHLVVILAAQDLHSLDDLLSRHYALRWEPLRASMYALCDHTPNSLSYVTSSSRSYIYYISDILRSSLAFPLPASFVIPLSIDDLVTAATTMATSMNSAVYFPPSMVASFAPLEDWVLDFVTLLVRALTVFVNEMTSSRSRVINSVIQSHVPATAPGYPLPSPDKPEPPIPFVGAQLTPEISLSSMGSLAGTHTSNLPPAPLVPRQHPPSPPPSAPVSDPDVQILSPSTYSGSSSLEVSAPVLTTFSPSNTDISSPMGTPIPANIGTPTPPSPDLSGAPPLLVESTATPPVQPTSPSLPGSTSSTASEPIVIDSTPPSILSPPQPSPAPPTLTVTPSQSRTPTPPPSRPPTRTTTTTSTSSSSRAHTPARVPLDYHFEFLLGVSSLDAPLSSILFDIPTLTALQNLIALVGLTAATPVPGKAEKHQLKDIRSKHHLVGSIIAKLQQLLDKDPNYYKIEYVEMLALRYSEALAEFAIPGSVDEMRTNIARDLRALNLDNPWTPLRHKPTPRPPTTPIFDVLHFATFTPAEGPFRECLRCGRATRGTTQQKGAALWAERWAFVCPICNGKWFWIQ